MMCDEKLPSGSTSRCAAGGQTTGPGKRAVVSHVQTSSADRSSPRVPRGNRATPVNDRVAGMKNLEDYLPAKVRTKSPVKLPESPIMSPDTAEALENAEKLVQEAQKKIIEASYDIPSSPERENSIGSARDGKTDDDALYIRDIVSTRFHEANESARIFTRPLTRPLAERLCRPEVRQRRAKRLGEKFNKIRTEESSISRTKPLKLSSRKVGVSSYVSKAQESISRQRDDLDEGISSRIPKTKLSMPFVQRSSCKIANQNTINSFKVQEGPRVNIRNELTVTNVENVDISPQPHSTLPVQRNIKTYEFRHKSCIDDNVKETSRNEEAVRSTKLTIGINGSVRDSPEVTEKSRVPLRKSPGAEPASLHEGSWSDLVGNKSGQSIQPEQSEGHADNATKMPKLGDGVADENKENRGESFIDFLRNSVDKNSTKIRKDHKSAEALKNRVFGALNTKDKIKIFNRAIDEFFDDFKRSEREAPVEISPEENSELKNKNDIPERDVDHLIGTVFHDESNLFTDNWDPQEINLEAPNLGELEKSVRKFDGTIDKVLRGTRSLGVLMSQYSMEVEILNQPEIELVNRELSNNPTLFHLLPSRDIPDSRKQKGIHPVGEKKALTNYQENKIPIRRGGDSSICSEGSKEISKLSRCKASREAIAIEIEKNLPAKFVGPHPRYSTPLNNAPKIGSPHRLTADFKSNEFARFLAGIQRPKASLESQHGTVTNKIDASSTQKKNELLPSLNIERQKKIVLDEIDRNCNFDSLFNRDRRGNKENEEKSDETVTFPTYTTREKRESSEFRNSRTRSLIQDSAIGRTTDHSEKIYVGTNLVDERVMRKDSSRSEQSAPIKKNDDVSTKDSLSTRSLTVKKNSDTAAGIINVETKDEKKSAEHAEVMEENSVKNDETNDKNRLVASAGSSLKDRTSFDISTAYSDDFEEPVVSNATSESQENLISKKTVSSKAISDEKNSPENKSEERLLLKVSNKDGEKKIGPSSSPKSPESLQLKSESVKVSEYLEKSVTISVNKSSDKNEDKKETTVSKEETLKTDSEKKDAHPGLSGDSEKLSKDKSSVVSSSASTKASASSSSVGESSGGEPKQSDESKEVEPSGDFIIINLKAVERKEYEENLQASELVIEATNNNLLAKSLTNSNKLNFVKTDEHLTKCLGKNVSNNVESLHQEECIKQNNIEVSKNIEEKEEPQHLEQHEISTFHQIDSLSNEENKLGRSSSIYSQEADLESWKNLEKIGNFGSSAMIHSTPKSYISNSTHGVEALIFPFPDPIPDDDQIEGAADTCSENYSEGELYLASSCSYSLGEIRISERPSYEAVGAGIESSSRNADGIRMFFRRGYATINSSDNTIGVTKTTAESPGEVQETDVESICSLRGSDGEHGQRNEFTVQA